ncbi:hypothetical protein [Methanobrevibacter sp.]
MKFPDKTFENKIRFKNPADNINKKITINIDEKKNKMEIKSSS